MSERADAQPRIDARQEFIVPGPGPYLASHAVGCPTKAAIDALQRDFVQPWATRGIEAWDSWLAAIGAFREGLAQLFRDEAANFCPQPTVSAALAALLGARRADAAPRRRRIWLLHEQTFASLGFVLAQTPGIELRWLRTGADDPANPRVWADAISEEIEGVLVMHVHSNTGVVAPVREIARRCREVGAYSVIDVAQSAGILPIALRDWDADVVIGSCVKWLCGGPGAGFLWLRPELSAALQPASVGWFSHEQPFEFDIHDFRYAPGAARFWGGTPSIAPYAAAAASLRTILALGMQRIHAHNRELMHEFREALPPRWRSRIDTARIGGTLCLDADEHLDRLQAALRERQIRCDARGRTIRLSFHIFNTPQEARLAAQAWQVGSQ